MKSDQEHFILLLFDMGTNVRTARLKQHHVRSTCKLLNWHVGSVISDIIQLCNCASAFARPVAMLINNVLNCCFRNSWLQNVDPQQTFVHGVVGGSAGRWHE